MSNENFKPPYTANESLSPKVIWYNSRIKLKFKESCLKQEDKTVILQKCCKFIYCLWIRYINTYFTLIFFSFGSVKLTKNVYLDKCKYSGYGIGFNLHNLTITYNLTIPQEQVSLFLELIWAHLWILIIKGTIS